MTTSPPLNPCHLFVAIQSLLLVALTSATSLADTPTTISSEGRDFFESKIRPILVSECLDCHDAQKTKGGLRLDYRDGWKKGGDSGEVLIPGDPSKSLLLKSIRHEDPDLKMPSKAPKLDPKVIADFEKWVLMGAPDPRDEPPKAADSKSAWPQLLSARRTWWALQPVSQPEVPKVLHKEWSSHPVDLFVLSKIEEHQLQPAAPAAPRTLLRRLSFTLTGLPPAPDELAAFDAAFTKNPQAAVESSVDRLLASQQFGEHWARHWMDLVRYSESHGSEGDPPIREAWRYRDYLIRAFNKDISWDQIIREHIAGDLLHSPRFDQGGLNESALATAHLRMVEHGYQPVDTLDDQVKAVDNQIDVITKAFQGFTVTCARCHDHKFDAISQRDYYAIYGVFANCRPAQITLDAPALSKTNREPLEALHSQIKKALAIEWRKAVPHIHERIHSLTSNILEEQDGTRAVLALRNDESNPLWPWIRLDTSTPEFSKRWSDWIVRAKNRLSPPETASGSPMPHQWNLASEDTSEWYRYGNGLCDGTYATGEFSIESSGDRILKGLYPAGLLTHRLSSKHNGILTSPSFKIEEDEISIRAFGDHDATVRLIVDQYPLGNPTSLFPQATLQSDTPGWIHLKVDYRKGSTAYLEISTRDDLTRTTSSARIERNSARKEALEKAQNEGRSYFGVQRVVFHDSKNPPKDEPSAVIPLLGEPQPNSQEQMSALYQKHLSEAITAWEEGRMNESQRSFLDAFIRTGILPVQLGELPDVAPLISEYRKLEAQVPIPRRAPGVLETKGADAPLFARGDIKKPGELVPRAYLEVLDGKPFKTQFSGRLELAEAMTSKQNPLTSRVMANRLWHWVFGTGIVPTVDNFGRMGETPTHPELLDFLASVLVENQWSLKKTLRLLVTSKTFAMDSAPSPEAQKSDPNNQWLSHMRIRRLEAESIRDNLLSVSGRLDPTMYGPGGNLNSDRRSVYQLVHRNSLNKLLGVFDAPVPFTTMGRRDVTNVPAQALTLLNDPFVIEAAKSWAHKLTQSKISTSIEQRVELMFEKAFGRKPDSNELAASLTYLQKLTDEYHLSPERSLAPADSVWRDFAQALFNLKEFIYLR